MYSCCFVGGCFQDLFKTASLYSSHVAFSINILLKSRWCNHTVVLTRTQLGRIGVEFYQRGQIYKWIAIDNLIDTWKRPTVLTIVCYELKFDLRFSLYNVWFLWLIFITKLSTLTRKVGRLCFMAHQHL